MRLKYLIAALLVACLPAIALAQPAAQSDYLLQLPSLVPPGANNHVPPAMMQWCDDSVPFLPTAQNCTPRVASNSYPMPNAIRSVPQAARSAAWIDASFTVGTSANTPSGGGSLPLATVAALGAQIGGRVGIHVFNLSATLVCMNYTGVAAVASASGCAPGSQAIPGNSAYVEDQPGNVSPEALSFICAAAACPLTIKLK